MMKKLEAILLTSVVVLLIAVSSRAQSPIASPAPPLVRPRVVGAPIATPTPAAAPRPTIIAPSPTPMVVSPATQTGAYPPPVAESPIVVPFLPPIAALPNPVAHPLPPTKIEARTEEALRLMRSRPLQTAMISPAAYSVRLAAFDTESSLIHTVTLPKEIFLRLGTDATLTTSLGTRVRLRIVRANYVNTAVTINDATGRQFIPLVVEYPIEKFGRFSEMAYYTSVHPALVSPELVRSGQTYVRTMLDLAAKRLRDKGVVISPQLMDVAERLCIVEHVDHDRFRRENRLAIYEEVFSLYALNKLDTYRYSVSSAGAGGMVQMIAPTYQMVRRRHPGAGLNPDFVAGMRNHGNALEAMLLYMQDTWNDLLVNPDVTYALDAKLATPAELLSAGYNSNPAKLGGYIRRGGAAWRTFIPRETQIYLEIYRSLDSLVPMKTRA
ncbi:MAG: hypothetical protein H0V88_10925 [Pyrinomonadaceae bacterium]|nr:hypothetical protein [Pyrinomonadaceae bacterium]